MAILPTDVPSGAGTSRPRLRASRSGAGRTPGAARLSWLGLVPFFLFVGSVFLVPIGFVVVQAFRRTTSGEAHRDPVTQQFVRATETHTTLANVKESLEGVYLSSLGTSVKLSAITAVLGAILGLLLAYAVVTSRGSLLKQVVSTAAAVTANFGGVPLAFLFIATLDANVGVVTLFLDKHFGLSLSDDLGLSLAGLSGLTLVYLYFLVPLMVLVMMPALEGLKVQWAEAAENLGASRWQYWRWVAAPVLLPSVLGSLLLLFCSAFSAYATAYAINSSFPLVTIRISSVLSGNVLSGQENLGAALALNMIVIVLPLTVVYQLLQRRTSRWLA